jgi:hypothetical protein
MIILVALIYLFKYHFAVVKRRENRNKRNIDCEKQIKS